MTARIVQCILSTDHTRGKGIEGDPLRIITRLYALDGTMICELDCWDDAPLPSVVHEAGLSRLGSQR